MNPTEVKFDFLSALPSSTTVANVTAVTLPVTAVEFPSTVSDAICVMAVNGVPLVFNVTHPSVTVNRASSKLASPLSACVIPVALALVLAAVMANLL